MNKKTNPVVCLACSDLHLSENAPVARSAEPDWFAAMRRPLDEVRALQRKYNCPILFGGDLFDKWNSHPVLINFALESLPHEMICITGNHDTPYHNPDLIGQSAYWTMLISEKITDIDSGILMGMNGFDLFAFPFGTKISKPYENPTKKIHDSNPKNLKVALIHAYCYINEATTYPNSPTSGHIRTFKLRGYSAVFFGDNHFPWSVSKQTPAIMNCGTMLRRKADEIEYEPGCGLLRADGTIERYPFDCSRDKFIDGADKLAAAETVTGLDLSGFAEELRGLAAAGLDFRDALIRRCGDNSIGADIKKIILKAAGL